MAQLLTSTITTPIANLAMDLLADVAGNRHGCDLGFTQAACGLCALPTNKGLTRQGLALEAAIAAYQAHTGQEASDRVVADAWDWAIGPGRNWDLAS